MAGPIFSNLTVMKVVDKTSPLLFDDCVTGNILKTVDLIYDKPMGDQQEDYFKIHMENALITSIQHSGSNENPIGIDLVCLREGEGQLQPRRRREA